MSYPVPIPTAPMVCLGNEFGDLKQLVHITPMVCLVTMGGTTVWRVGLMQPGLWNYLARAPCSRPRHGEVLGNTPFWIGVLNARVACGLLMQWSPLALAQVKSCAPGGSKCFAW